MRFRAHIESLVPVGMIGYRLYIFGEDPRSGLTFLHPPTLTVIETGADGREAPAFLDDGKHGLGGPHVREFLQAMSDAAWDIGVKPNGLENYSGELGATKYHLEDMRQLVLGKVKP